jgi:hypothetical protein
MKLGFAFLLLTGALLFSQKPITPEDVMNCHHACDTKAVASVAACQKAAKTDPQKKACATKEQYEALCYKTCPVPPQKR